VRYRVLPYWNLLCIKKIRIVSESFQTN